jgi:hypothetical protein
MESKTIDIALLAVSLISVIAFSSLAVELPANSYSYMSHSKTYVPRSTTTSVSPEPGMVFSDNFNDHTLDETGTYGSASSIFDNLSMTCNNLATGPTPTPTPAAPGACTWFVSPSGSFGGKGSIGSPWSLKRLFGGDPGFDGIAPPSVIRAGDTICLRGGTYSGFFQTILMGTASKPIVIQAYPGERATIDSAALAGGTSNTNDGVRLGSEGGQFGYITLRDLEITDSYATDRTNARPGGISITAPGVKVINCIIHDTGGGIGTNDSAYDTEFYGNVIYNVGWDDTKTGLRQGGTGHGMYVQNRYGFKKIYDNIITDSFGYGLHAYVGGDANLKNLDVQGNVSSDNGYWTRIQDSSYASEGRTTSNFLFGSAGTPVKNLTFKGNYGFHREQRGGMNLELGYGGKANTSATVQDNVLIGGTNGIAQFDSISFSHNLIASSWEELHYIASPNVAQVSIDNNTYYFYNSDCSGMPFTIGGLEAPASVTQWKAKGFDASSTIYPCGKRPTGVKVDVRRNAYDERRANIIVTNYSRSATVIVDLSPVLKAGDSFEIRNAQDYFGPVVLSGTYQGGGLGINMSGLSVARPVGWSGRIIPSSAPEFGAFVLIKR